MRSRFIGALLGLQVTLALSGCSSDDTGEPPNDMREPPNGGAGGEGAGAGGEGAGTAEAGTGASGENGGDENAGAGGESGEPDLSARCADADALAGITRPEGWKAHSHCKLAPADVERVFPARQVKQLTIRMTAGEYEAMQADLEDLQGGNGMGTGGAGGEDDTDWLAPCAGKAAQDACEVVFDGKKSPGVCAEFVGQLACFLDEFRAPLEQREACAQKEDGDSCATAEFEGVCVFDGVDEVCAPPDTNGEEESDPCAEKSAGATCRQGESDGTCRSTTGPLICEVDGFDEVDLSGVAIDAAARFWAREPRYFHASLAFDGEEFTSVGIRYKGNNGLATAEGEKKPLRVKMDEWEGELPEVTDQRLFGFQSLSFSPNQTDDSQLHQVLASEVLRANGIPAPHSSLVEVSLDTGAGPRLLGVYAMTELPDDQLPEREFGNDDGSMYKPDGRGAHLVSFIAESMHPRKDDATFEDVRAFIDALHASQRDRATWRAGLRATFDMDAFIGFFAVNQAIGNWDTYGGYAHNFYLYGDTATKRLRFLPWDFDLSFDGTGPSDFSLRSFGGEWPLLQAVARDTEFATLLRDRLGAFATTELDSGKLSTRIEELEELVTPAIEREEAVRPDSKQRFVAAMARLKAHVADQAKALAKHLGSGK